MNEAFNLSALIETPGAASCDQQHWKSTWAISIGCVSPPPQQKLCGFKDSKLLLLAIRLFLC